LISWLQSRWDNALAVKELRVLLRGHLGRDEQTVFSVVLVGFLLAALYRADISSAVLEGPARLLFGSAVAGGGPIYSGGGGVLVVFGGMAAVLLLIMTFAATASATAVCGTAFGRERDKSTLGFVLATPLSTRSILLGKFLGMLTPTLLAISLLAVWCALLCLPVAMELGTAQTLTGLFFGVVNCLLVVILGGSFGLALSTLLRREADSTSLAFLLLFLTLGGVGYLTFVWPQLLAGRTVATIQGQWIWLGYLALADAILVTSALSFAHWRLSRARHGDIAFESAVK
jgi:ABC-type transport system involved in multi-copper enzyme maturation permease subunit